MTLRPAVIGTQVPRVAVLPSGVVRSSGSDAAELAELGGMVLDPWQREVLTAGLAERADGLWAAFDVDLIASRQNGKNGGVEARELYGLVVLGEWFIHTSHLFTTTKESYFRLLSLIEYHPDLKEQLVYQVASPASGYEMRFRGGGRIKFIARSRTSGRGLTGDVLVFDEAQDLSDDAQGALLPVVSARPNPQVWRLGSAPGPDSLVWQRRRTHGRTGGTGRLAYFEYSADPEADLDDRAAWAQANPGLGIRVTEAVIEAERLAMSDEMFARERLSISPELVDGGRFIPADDWQWVCSPDVAPDGELVFGVDVSPEREKGFASIVACDDRGRLEVVDSRPGVAWLNERVAELGLRHRATVAVDSASPAHSFADGWERAGVTVERLTSREMAGACGTFYDAVLTHSIQVRSSAVFDKAAAGARKRDSGDVWYWARKDMSVDVTPIVAASVARWIAVGPSVYEERGPLVLG